MLLSYSTLQCQNTGNTDPFGSLLTIELDQVYIAGMPVAVNSDQICLEDAANGVQSSSSLGVMQQMS